MLERFLAAFTLTAGSPVSPLRGEVNTAGLISALGGRAFDMGLYRIHTDQSSKRYTDIVEDAFPEFNSRLTCFGYDWLGRQFATDKARGRGDDPGVVLFEPGTGEALEIPVSFSEFHDSELVDDPEAALAASAYEEWIGGGGAVPDLNYCIGHKIPPMLGGADEFVNMELSDMDVHWTIMGSICRQLKNMPPGTKITGVGIEDSGVKRRWWRKERG